MKNRTAHRRRRIRNKRRSARRESGNALLAVIGIVAVLAGLAVAYQATVQSQSRTYDALAASITHQNAADAAANLGIWRVVRDWRAEGGNPAGAVFLCIQNGVLVRLAIEDEARRLNVNLADGASIAREIAHAGFSPARAAAIGGAIADYVDRDDRSFEGGSERERFDPSSVAAPKNRPLEVIDELRLVPGIDAETFEALRDIFSIHSPRSDREPTQGSAPGETDSSPRGVYRIVVAAGNAGERAVRASRTTVIELDPARPFEPAIKAWTRNVVSLGNFQSRKAQTEVECRQAILGD